MPRNCPHCGLALTGTVDAFCPECREDLSATPEEARKAAAGAFKVLKGAFGATVGHDANATPEQARETSAGYALSLTGMAGVGLVTTVLQGEWAVVPLAAILFVLGVLWLRGEYRSREVRTSVTSRGKAFKDSDEKK